MDNIGITENSMNVSADLAAKLSPYMESGFLHLDAWGADRAAQNLIFTQCFERFRETHDWVAFFDADEYLMLLERCVRAVLQHITAHL